MMVNCLKCNSRIHDRHSWQATCYECGNKVAMCTSCFSDYIDKHYKPNRFWDISCCEINKDYHMMSNS